MFISTNRYVYEYDDDDAQLVSEASFAVGDIEFARVAVDDSRKTAYIYYLNTNTSTGILVYDIVSVGGGDDEQA